MMQKKWGLVFLIVGALFLALGMFGAQMVSGLRFAVTAWSDNFDDNNLDTNRWSIVNQAGVSVVETNQHLSVVWTSSIGAGGVMTTSPLNLDSQSIKITVVSFPAGETVVRIGTGTTLPFDYYLIVKQSSSQKTIVKRMLAGTETVVLDTQLGWNQTGIMQISISGSTIQFYSSGNLVASDTYALGTKNLYVTIYGYYGLTNPNTINFDDFVYSGDSSSPTTGSLNVVGYYNGVAVAMTGVYYKIGSTTSTPISVPASGYTWSGLSPGSYTVYGTYNAVEKNSGSVAVVVGQTAHAQIAFAGSVPITDPLQPIKDMLNDPTVKMALTVSGGGSMGIGFIILVYPSGKKKVSPYFGSYY
jgi:hypothetical protein